MDIHANKRAVDELTSLYQKEVADELVLEKEVDVKDTRRTVDAIRAYDKAKDASRDATWDTMHGKKKKGKTEKKYAAKERGEIDKDDPNWKHRKYHTGIHGEEAMGLYNSIYSEVQLKKELKDLKKAAKTGKGKDVAKADKVLEAKSAGQELAQMEKDDDAFGAPNPKKKKLKKEAFSDWRTDLTEIISSIPETEPEAEKEIKEKKVKNKVVIDPEIKLEKVTALGLQSVAEDLGGTVVGNIDEEEMDILPLNIEVPTTSGEFRLGLMFRESLEEDSGMLFTFEESAQQSFHMKDTKIPLDIAFITQDGIIESIKELEPYVSLPVYSEGPIRYALEVNRGWFAEHNIEVGDQLIDLDEVEVSKKKLYVRKIEEGDFWHPDPEKDKKLGGPGPNQRAREDRASTQRKTKDYSKSLKPGESYMQFAKRKQREREMGEEIESVVEYFYEEGINEEGIDLLIEEIGLEEFVDFVEGGAAVELTEERAARRASVRAKKYPQVKAEVDKADAARKKAKKGEYAPSYAKKETDVTVYKDDKPKATKKKAAPKAKGGAIVKAKSSAIVKKAVDKVKPAQPKKPASKEGLRAKIKSAYDAGVKRHKKAVQPARVFGKGFKRGVTDTVKFAKKAKKAVVGEAYKAVTNAPDSLAKMNKRYKPVKKIKNPTDRPFRDRLKDPDYKVDMDEKLDYDPMDDPDFDPREAEKKRGVSGKNNPKGGKKLKDLTKEEWKPDPVEKRKKKAADLHRRETIASATPKKYKTDKTEDPDKLYRRRMAVDSKTKIRKEEVVDEAKVDTGKSADEKATARNKRNNPPGANKKFDTSVFITRKPGESLDSARTRKRREAHARKRGGSHMKSASQGQMMTGKGTIYANEDTIAEKDLNAAERRALPNKDFALPGKGKGPEGKQSGSYPIPDKNHARMALSMVSKHGSAAEKATVRAKVRKKFPDIKVTEDKAFDNVVAALRKKHGEAGVLTKDSPKPKAQPRPKAKPQKPLTAAEKAQREVDARYGRTPWNKKGSLGT